MKNYQYSEEFLQFLNATEDLEKLGNLQIKSWLFSSIPSFIVGSLVTYLFSHSIAISFGGGAGCSMFFMIFNVFFALLNECDKCPTDLLIKLNSQKWKFYKNIFELKKTIYHNLQKKSFQYDIITWCDDRIKELEEQKINQQDFIYMKVKFVKIFDKKTQSKFDLEWIIEYLCRLNNLKIVPIEKPEGFLDGYQKHLQSIENNTVLENEREMELNDSIFDKNPQTRNFKKLL